MAEQPVKRRDQATGNQEEPPGREHRNDGYEGDLAQYQAELAHYLQERIKPGLSSGAIPLLARSIAKELAGEEPPEAPEAGDSPDESEEPVPDFEEDMYELQAELGEDWILRFSVHGDEGWLTAEKSDYSQRVEAPNAEALVKIVEAIDDAEGRQG